MTYSPVPGPAGAPLVEQREGTSKNTSDKETEMPPENYRQPTTEEIKADRVSSTYGRASVHAREAVAVLGKGWPHDRTDRDKLAKAAASLNAYLAELES